MPTVAFGGLRALLFAEKVASFWAEELIIHSAQRRPSVFEIPMAA